ncbi:MAG: hypothetical protein HFE80_04485 [Clostridiaceae bacterium]|jgi:hypothetical protein|nr:hypothetical protein [Clostridiaceae bacterium]
MPEASDTQSILRQNLVDAGCGLELIRQCTALIQQKEIAKLMQVLSCHRRTLLDAVHQNEKRIDCLDYLIDTLEKQND